MRASIECLFSSAVVLSLLLMFTTGPALTEQGVAVIRNGDKGLWDREKTRGLELKRALTIASDEKPKEAVFGNITGIAVDSHINIYAIDFSDRRVMVFDSTGSFRFSFGRPGNGPGEFISPSAIAVDQHNNIFVADQNGLTVFDTEGRYITVLPLKATGMIRDIAIDSEDNLYVCWFEPLDQDIIHKYNAQGELVKSFCKSWAKGKDVDTRIEATFAGGYVSIDKNGDVLFTQMMPYEIRRYSSEGVLKGSVYRDNSFMGKPEDYFKVDGDRIHFSLAPTSSGIFTLRGDYFANCAVIPAVGDQKSFSVVDLFNAKGEFLASMKLDYPVFLRCQDRLGRVYGVVPGDIPTIVRYDFIIK